MTTYQLKQVLNVYADYKRMAEMASGKDDELYTLYSNRAQGVEKALSVIDSSSGIDNGNAEKYLVYTTRVMNGESIRAVICYKDGFADEQAEYIYFPSVQAFDWELQNL